MKTNRQIIEEHLLSLATELVVTEAVYENNNICAYCRNDIMGDRVRFVTGEGYTHCTKYCATMTILNDFLDKKKENEKYIDYAGRSILEPYTGRSILEPYVEKG